jgi:hypothetical protein
LQRVGLQVAYAKPYSVQSEGWCGGDLVWRFGSGARRMEQITNSLDFFASFLCQDKNEEPVAARATKKNCLLKTSLYFRK